MVDRDESDRKVKKQTRRGIVDLLNMARPMRLDYETICGSFVTIDEHYIRRDLDYLEVAGYVEWANPRANAPWTDRIYVLTRTGIELADRINTDPALEP